MISTILYSVLAAVVFILDVVKFCYKLTKIGCSWLAVVTVLLIVVLTRYFRLKKPPSAVVDCILGNAISSSTGAHRHDEMTSIDWWPIANRAACLDALENSKTAIEKCVEQKCKNILLDVEITKCGQLVILHRQTLKRIESSISSNATGATEVHSINFEDLKSLNIAKNHPLCEKYSPERVLHFDELIRMLNVYKTMNVFLLVGPSYKRFVERFGEYIGNNENCLKRLILCSRSPLLIYQLRKANPNLICALWLDKTYDLKLPSFILHSSLFAFVHGILFRNLIACITGISVVFINKHDFNAHTSQIWRNAGIRPIVYTLNSPSEKRYFQQTLRTQYLTDSLRSEPHHFTKQNK